MTLGKRVTFGSGISDGTSVEIRESEQETVPITPGKGIIRHSQLLAIQLCMYLTVSGRTHRTSMKKRTANSTCNRRIRG